MILNLLNNAKDILIKYCIALPKIEISAKASEIGISIKVSDNGGGIPVDMVNKIYDPYFITIPFEIKDLN